MNHRTRTRAATAPSTVRLVPAWQLSDRTAVAAIVLAACIAFSPWWAGGRLLAPLDVLHETFAPWHEGDTTVVVHNHFTSDAITQYIVYRAFAARSFAQDGRIGWSDLTNAGRPEYANTMATYDDWTMQLHRVLDFWTAWHVGLLLQFIIAGCGMYVLLRSRRIVPLIALTGAVAFAASTPFVHTLYHRWHLGAFAWVPWLVWALLRQREGARGAALAAPVFLALALLGGSLQTAAFVVITLGSVWLGLLLEPTAARARWQWTRQVLLCSVLGAALAAFSLVPAVLTYVDGLALHGERSSLGYRYGWLQPLRALLFIPLQAVPSLLGSPRSLDLAKLFHADLANVAFFGFLPTVIALRCVFWKQAPLPARILIVLGLLLPLTPLVGPLYHRVQIVFVFGGVWAFAHYWQHRGAAADPFWRVLLVTVLVLGALWLAASAGLLLMHDRVAALLRERVADMVAAGGGGRLDGFGGWLEARAARLPAELSIWYPRQLFAVAGVGLGLLAVRLRDRGSLQRATGVLLLAVMLELGAVSASFVTYVDAARYPPYPPRADIAALRDLAGDGRVHIASTHDGPALLFPSNTLAMYGVATIEQFETVAVPGMWQAAGQREDARTLGRMAVTHAVAAPGTAVREGWRGVVRGARFDVWRNEHAVPRYLAVPARAEPMSYMDSVQSGGRAPAAVRVERATMNHRVLAVPAGTAQLRVGENWAEGWMYSVNGSAARPAERAADRSMLLPLSPAEHVTRVELTYRPQRRRIGWAISLAAALVLLPVGLGTLRAGEVDA